MRNISDTLARLAALRAAAPGAGSEAIPSVLDTLEGFGTNPGALLAKYHVPAGLGPQAPLVVVLHGCTQNAAGYDHGSGWSALADRAGFAVLFPEQKRANNPNLCFNWFMPEDTKRGGGEACSISEMIGAMLLEHDLDPARVYITGLSAGGAMTAVMLATYPELFAGGAIIAGLPFGSARSMPEALDRMRGHGGPDGKALAALVREASGHDGPWPTVSIWHGTADHTVAPANMDLIAAQWHGLHGTGAAPHGVEKTGNHTRSIWRGGAGGVAIERHEIAGMGHGTPIDPNGPDGLGHAMPHMLDIGVSSTALIARSWGIADTGLAQTAGRLLRMIVPAAAAPVAAEPQGTMQRAGGVQKIIEDALRTAGLMR
ncbi:PHB depolymerase family esterase [Sphingomonas oligophenolica]|uniref:PHB depolymerase family esterase n=1 Tax=Sphingomonas oligophenolica TaxID=301154 RepID=A0ABU9YCI0_9SPHN